MLPVDKQRGTLPGFLANPDNGVIAPVPVAFVLLAYPLVKPLIQAGEDSPQGRFSILTVIVNPAPDSAVEQQGNVFQLLRAHPLQAQFSDLPVDSLDGFGADGRTIATPITPCVSLTNSGLKAKAQKGELYR